MNSRNFENGTFVKYYTFEQIITKVVYDLSTYKNRLITFSNHVRTYELVNDLATDIPLKNEEINWIPEWKAFYWLTQGRLVIKID